MDHITAPCQYNDLARDMAETEYDAFDTIASSAQPTEAETAEDEAIESIALFHFNPDRITEHREYDIGNEIGCFVSGAQVHTNENILSDVQYRKLLSSLNSKQN